MESLGTEAVYLWSGLVAEGEAVGEGSYLVALLVGFLDKLDWLLFEREYDAWWSLVCFNKPLDMLG